MSETDKPLVKLTALIIDDSRVMRSLVMQALEQADLGTFEFLQAASGSEALDKFDVDKTNIIFVDWNMPGMDGIEFARQIRSMQWAKHIPIVMITSESGSEKQQNAYDRARITCDITKPFTAEILREKVGPLVDGIVARNVASDPSPVVGAQVPAPKRAGFFTRLLT